MASLTNVGNEFAAPSTASFGGSNEDNLEDATIQKQVLVPATAVHLNRPRGRIWLPEPQVCLLVRACHCKEHKVLAEPQGITCA